MATITAAAGGGAWNVGASWVGGVSPGSGDDVLLTVTSGNISIPTATTVACRSIDATGYIGTLTWASTTARLNVGDASGGNAKFVAGMTVTLTGVGILGFMSTTASTTYTLTSGGKTLPNIVVNAGASTTIQLADNLTAAATGTTGITLTSGILDLNSKTMVAPIMTLSGSTARTLTPGAANITLSGVTPWAATVITNLTITANTATVTMNSSTSATFNGGGKDYNGMTAVFTSTGESVITGVNTFGNLTRTGPAAIDGMLTLAGDQTVTGTLTLTGNAAANRLWVRSSVAGTARTLTVNTTVTASRVDFEDITGAGAASWNLAAITDGSGDMGGNSGITFTTAATKFGKAAGNWSSTATWALTSGGAAGAAFPLPQDDVVLDANTGAGTYTMNMQRHCKDLTCTGFTGTLSLASSATQRYIFGSLTLSAGMTFTANGNLTFAGRGSHTIDMAGKAFATPSSRTITVGRFGGTYTLTSAANFGNTTANTGTGLVTAGGVTLTAAGFNVTTPRVSLGVSTINMGSGTWNLTATGSETIWANAGALATINASTSNIVIANASASTRTFAGGSATYNDLTYTVAGSTGSLNLNGAANTFHDINFSDATNARSLLFTAGTTTGVTGRFNVNGTAGKLMTIGSITAASHGLAKMTGTVSLDYVSISFSSAAGGAAWYAGANSVNGGNNTGWIFSFPAGGNFFMFI